LRARNSLAVKKSEEEAGIVTVAGIPKRARSRASTCGMRSFEPTMILMGAESLINSDVPGS
jgi:hypothetical protein